MRAFDNPTAGSVAWDHEPAANLVSACLDVSYIPVSANQGSRVGVVVALVHAHVLPSETSWGGPLAYQRLQSQLHHILVMAVGPCNCHSQGDPSAISHETPFHARLSSVSGVFASLFAA